MREWGCLIMAIGIIALLTAVIVLLRGS